MERYTYNTRETLGIKAILFYLRDD